MTGPEHYREAERLLRIPAGGDSRAQEAKDRLTRKAQVHAMLALAWATDPLVGHDDDS